MIVKLYRRLAAHATTPNRFNRLRIALENRITPLELAALTEDAGPYEGPADEDDEENDGRKKAPPTTQADWCARLTSTSKKSGKADPEAFKRRRLRKGMLFLSSGGDKKSKVLCICFNSAARRMMMPTPVFLQHLDASLVDVLLLTDPDRDGFRRCFLDDENNLVKRISQLIDLDGYRGAVAIGTSGGGLPSVLAAIGLGLDAVLSVGGNDPYDLRWITPAGDDGAALVGQLVAAAKGKLPDVYLLYSEEYTLDATSAKALSALVSAREVAYYIKNARGVSRPIGHTVLQPILHRGTMCSLFNATVFSKFAPTKTGVEEDWSKFISEPTAV